jgi:acetyl esterase/lipase
MLRHAMPYRLDPELAEIARVAPTIDIRDVAAARNGMAAIAAQLAAQAAAPKEDRVRLEDRKIAGPVGAPPIPVRIYQPRSGSRPRALLVYLHGGAFCVGNLETEHARCLQICGDLGCSVVSVDYRLAPENPFPAGVEDCYAALVWAASHAAELGADPSRVAIGGGSAGGGLAAAVALMARDRGAPRLAFQLLIYPVLDDRLATPSMRAFTDTPIWDRANSVHMWRHYLGASSEASPYAAPARAADLSGLAPAYVMTAEFDPLRDEGIEYAMRLMQAGVPTELHNYPGAFHGFDIVGAATRIARAAVEEQIAVLRRAFESR